MLASKWPDEATKRLHHIEKKYYSHKVQREFALDRIEGFRHYSESAF